MGKRRPNPAQKVFKHAGEVPSEIRGLLRVAGVHVKPHGHMEMTTTLTGERTDGRGSIAQAGVVVDWRTLTGRQFVDWLRACADDYELVLEETLATQSDPLVV